jgi:predicted flap endonuclease-1-like 5' DNA nuclease
LVGLAFGLLVAVLFEMGFFWGLITTLCLGVLAALLLQSAFCNGATQSTVTNAQAGPHPVQDQAHPECVPMAQGFAGTEATSDSATAMPQNTAVVADEAKADAVKVVAGKADSAIAGASKADAVKAEAAPAASISISMPKAKAPKAVTKPAAKQKAAAVKASPKVENVTAKPAIAKSTTSLKAAAAKTAISKAVPKAAKVPRATARPVAADGKPEMLTAARGGQADNLKEIKGVGPKMEALLNRLGVYHFDQIAGWRAAEVTWVDENLEGFKGRVTRDAWVARAKTLAAGGDSAFSKRVDKGEVY